MDGFGMILGQKRRYSSLIKVIKSTTKLNCNPIRFSKGFKLIDRAISIMSYFGLREWKFDNRNVERLWNAINQSHVLASQLPFDMRTIDWPEYFRHYLPGINRHYFNQTDPKENQRCKETYKKLKFCHDTLKLIVWVVLPVAFLLNSRKSRHTK